MPLKRGEVAVFIVNVAYIVVLGTMALLPRPDYEFVIYGLVIILVFALIAATQARVGFPLYTLWGLTLWGFLHMAGGQVPIGAGRRLYELVFLPIATVGGQGEQVTLLRYDHLVHAVGFGVMTLVCFHLLGPSLKERVHNRAAVSVMVALMGMGAGALNEVMELFVVLVAPQSGVGGYYNNAFDLAFNMLGAALAVAWLNLRGMIR